MRRQWVSKDGKDTTVVGFAEVLSALKAAGWQVSRAGNPPTEVEAVSPDKSIKLWIGSGAHNEGGEITFDYVDPRAPRPFDHRSEARSAPFSARQLTGAEFMRELETWLRKGHKPRFGTWGLPR